MEQITATKRWIGTSAEGKPLPHSQLVVPNGSTFYETDTRLTFVFDGEDWHEQDAATLDDVLAELRVVSSTLAGLAEVVGQLASKVV